MMRINIIIMLLALAGCGEDFKRHLSQFSEVEAGMKSVRFETLKTSWLIYCGGIDSEAGVEFENSKEIFNKNEIINDLIDKAVISNGVYLYSKIKDDFYAVASIPHDRFPVNEIYLMVNGKFEKNGKVAYMQSGISIRKYEKFAKLVIANVVQEKCQ